MDSSFLLGIDLGTTICKAGIYSQKGKLVSYTEIEYGLIEKSGGIVEQDASNWWEVATEVIKKSIKKSGINKNRIRALSVSSQGLSFVPVDEKINPLSRSINWLDTRAEKETKFILKKIPFSKIFSITGKRAHPSYTLPKILWLMKEKPRIVDKTYKFLMPQDFLVAKLTGKCITDHTIAAGTLMYDINNLRWSKEVISQFDISIEKLPSVEWAASQVGTVSAQVAQKVGLSPETSVVVGGQDQKCAALSAGLSERTVTLSLGTAAALTAIKNKPIIDDHMRIPCFPYLLKNHWVIEGVVGTGGGSFRWLKQILGDTIYNYEELIDMAGKVSLGAKGVFFFPHLSGATSPHWRSKAKGIFYGLSLSTSTGDLIRSVLEGIAFQVKENLEILEELTGEVKEIKVFGGGAKSKLWGQIIASVTGKKVYLLFLGRPATIGACLLAGLGSGFYKSYQEAMKSLRNLPYIKINPNIHDQRKYEMLYSEYSELEAKILEITQKEL